MLTIGGSSALWDANLDVSFQSSNVTIAAAASPSPPVAIIDGPGFIGASCPGTTTGFSAQFSGFNSPFSGGRPLQNYQWGPITPPAGATLVQIRSPLSAIPDKKKLPFIICLLLHLKGQVFVLNHFYAFYTGSVRSWCYPKCKWKSKDRWSHDTYPPSKCSSFYDCSWDVHSSAVSYELDGPEWNQNLLILKGRPSGAYDHHHWWEHWHIPGH